MDQRSIAREHQIEVLEAEVDIQLKEIYRGMDLVVTKWVNNDEYDAIKAFCRAAFGAGYQLAYTDKGDFARKNGYIK